MIKNCRYTVKNGVYNYVIGCKNLHFRKVYVVYMGSKWAVGLILYTISV